MFARVVTMRGKPDIMDEFVQIYKESFVSAMKAQPGFQGTILLVKGEETAVSISLWATEAEMQAGEASGYLQAQFAKVEPFFAAPPTNEHFEVRVQV